MLTYYKGGVCFPAGRGARGRVGIRRDPPLCLRGSFRLARCGKNPRSIQLQRLPVGFQKQDRQF